MKDETIDILVVDDEEDIRKIFEKVLKLKGYKAEGAETGSEAISCAKSKFFNIVFIDIKLPDMSGLEVLKAIKEINEDTVAIMITAYASIDSSVEAMRRGAYFYIIKPVNMDQVLAVMREAIDKQQLSIENKRLNADLVKEITTRKKTEAEREKFLEVSGERVRELDCLYKLSKLAEKPNFSLEQIFQEAINLLPPAWQYPEVTCGRIMFGGKEFKTDNFKTTSWKLSADLEAYKKKVGVIEIYYVQKKPGSYEGPFLQEERNLIDTVAEQLSGVIERKKAEEGLKRANEELKKFDKLKSDFVSTVSHELRTPLSITKEGVSLVLDGIPGKINEKQEKVLTVARDNIDRLTRIINSLLDISRIEAGAVEIEGALINIGGLVKQVVSSFALKAKGRGLELRTKLPPKRVDVYIDVDKITQVFINLIDNAIKFTEKGHIEVSVNEKKDRVECAVADTGAGIPKEDLPKVFGRFQQIGRVEGAGERGTGLGLSIAKEMIDMHNGKFWVDSELGKGAKFTFTVPKYAADVLFKMYVNNGIRDALKKGTEMSLIIVSIAEFEKLKRKMPGGKIQPALKDMENVLKSGLRRAGDAAFEAGGEIVVVLADCSRESALRVKGRLEQDLDDYLARQNLAGKIKLRFGCAVYPDDAGSGEELITKAKATK